MTSPPQIDASALSMEARHLTLVREILRQHIPGTQVWAFGSRATGRHLKPYSDLDLAVEGRLAAGKWMELVDAFVESSLPIKVDVVELDGVDAEFRERIANDFVVVQGAVKGLEECDPTHAPSASA